MTTIYKNVEHKIDWLQQIDGLSVTGAINYLISLGNADLILNCYLDGDTYGCNLVSNIIERVPMTKEERIVQANKYWDERITHYNSSYKNARRAEDADWIASLDRIKNDLEDKRVNAISKINKEYEPC